MRFKIIYVDFNIYKYVFNNIQDFIFHPNTIVVNFCFEEVHLKNSIPTTLKKAVCIILEKSQNMSRVFWGPFIQQKVVRAKNWSEQGLFIIQSNDINVSGTTLLLTV